MNVWLKRVGYTIGAIVALLLIIVSFVYGMSEREFRKTYSVAPESVPVSDDSAPIARGTHLAIIVGCADRGGENRSGHAVIDTAPHGVVQSERPLLLMRSFEFQHKSDGDGHAIAS